MCPLLEADLASCAAHLTMRNLPQAFAHCVEGYHACPVYQRIIRERANRAKRQEVYHPVPVVMS